MRKERREKAIRTIKAERERQARLFARYGLKSAAAAIRRGDLVKVEAAPVAETQE